MVQGSAACPLSGARTAREGGDGRRDGTRAISTHRMVSSVPPDTHSCAAAATQRTGPLCAGAVTSCARGRVRTYRHIAAPSVRHRSPLYSHRPDTVLIPPGDGARRSAHLDERGRIGCGEPLPQHEALITSGEQPHPRHMRDVAQMC